MTRMPLAQCPCDNTETAKRRAAEATLGKVEIDNNVLDNVYSFEYLGSRLQGDGDDEADVILLRTVYCNRRGPHDSFLLSM